MTGPKKRGSMNEPAAEAIGGRVVGRIESPYVERRPVPDPGVTVGPYRILQRTCGDFIVFDDRAPPAQNVAGGGATIDEAKAAAEELVRLGAPIRPVNYPVPKLIEPKPARPRASPKSRRS